MSTAIAPIATSEIADTRIAELAHQALELARESVSPATLRSYQAAVRSFSAWCKASGVVALPAEPEPVALYIAEQVEREASASTIAKHMAAIRWWHRAEGHDSPTTHPMVEKVWRGARRRLSVAPTPKRALSLANLRRAVRALDRDTMRGRRDAALLLVGWAGAFRRSELVALDVADLDFADEGVVVVVRRSKTDQEGAGRRVSILRGRGDTCPVRALRDWLSAAGIDFGPVFRGFRKGDRVTDKRLSGRAVALVVKRAAELVGLDGADFAGHSLRRGLVTEAYRAGRTDAQIMSTTGHKSRAMLDRYREEAGRFEDAAAAGLL